MDLFEAYDAEKRASSAAGKKREGCASADSILDGHDAAELDAASFQLETLLAKSCPHLSHRPHVSCATQTDDVSAANAAAQQQSKKRAPQIGNTR